MLSPAAAMHQEARRLARLPRHALCKEGDMNRSGRGAQQHDLGEHSAVLNDGCQTVLAVMLVVEEVKISWICGGTLPNGFGH